MRQQTQIVLWRWAMIFLCLAAWVFIITATVHPAHAQQQVLPYTIKSSKTCSAGDGTLQSCPLPIVGTGGVGPYPFTPLGCQQLTSLGSATGITAPAGTTLISLTVESQPVRMRDDGTNPTASVGLLLPVGGPWPYSGSMTAVKFIQTAASATIDLCAYK